MTQLLEQIENDMVMRLRRRFPTAVRSSNWDEMVRLAKGGRFDDAVALAQKMEQKPHILTQNVVARRVRVARAPMLELLKDAEKELKVIFLENAEWMVSSIERWADSRANLKKLQQRSKEMTVELRRDLKAWLRRNIWDSGKMSLKNAQTALTPIFKYNWESLREDRLVFDMDKSVANLNDPGVKITSKKWTSKLDKIVAASEKEIRNGLNFNQRLYQMTDNARREVDRLVAAGIVDGDSPADIARSVKKYMSPATITDEDGSVLLPKGAYYSPFKNALRMARTEMLKTYHQTTAAYASDKWWIKGLMITLADSHDVEDICDEYDGKVVSPEEYAELVPFHPHCMCYGAYVFDPELEALAADAEKEQEDAE